MLQEKNRLKSKKEISEIFAEGKTVRNSFLFLKYRENKLKNSRFAFSIGLKYSKKAVERNRIRRVLRESLRELMPNVVQGYDGIFFLSRSLNPEKKLITSTETKKTLTNILMKANLWQNKNLHKK